MGTMVGDAGGVEGASGVDDGGGEWSKGGGAGVAVAVDDDDVAAVLGCRGDAVEVVRGDVEDVVAEDGDGAATV
jgi:hypothetical protein